MKLTSRGLGLRARLSFNLASVSFKDALRSIMSYMNTYFVKGDIFNNDATRSCCHYLMRETVDSSSVFINNIIATYDWYIVYRGVCIIERDEEEKQKNASV